MKKKILMGLIVFALFALIGGIGCGKPAPSPTPATTPTHAITPTPTFKTKTVAEVVKAALAGKYKYGDVIRVSGVVTGEEINGSYQKFYYVGPAGDNGFFVIFRVYVDPSSAEYMKFYMLRKGERIVVEAKYDQAIGDWKGVILNDPIILSQEPP